MVSSDENLRIYAPRLHQNVLYIFFSTRTHTHTLPKAVPLHPGTVVCMKETAPPIRIQHVEPSGQA